MGGTFNVMQSRVLRKAVENGNNLNIVISHMAFVHKKAIGQLQPTISWSPPDFSNKLEAINQVLG